MEMNLILLLLTVLVAAIQTDAEPATEPENSATVVDRDGRILIQDNYYSIMSKVEQQEKEIAALKTQDNSLNTEVTRLKAQDTTLNANVATLMAEVALLKTQENALKAEVASLKAQQVAAPARVAFNAHLTQAISPGPNQLIEFNDIRFNTGNAYRHGTFIAPYSGTYLFSVTMCSYKGHYIYVDLLRNGTMIGTVLAGDTLYDACSSETTVTELTFGDDVIVQHQKTRGDSIFADSGLHSSFMGVLLY